jgi:hypothetical protein
MISEALRLAVRNLPGGKFALATFLILTVAIIIRSIVAPGKSERIVVEGTKVHTEPLPAEPVGR